MSSKALGNISSLRSRLIRGAGGSFILQVGFAGISFLNAIILARVLGPDGYGAFSNGMAWISLLIIPATFGFGILLVRDIAIYRSKKKWSMLKGLLRFSDFFVLILSVKLSFFGAWIIGYLFSHPDQLMMRQTLWVALPLLPLLALSSLREAGTRGLEHVILARFPGMIVRPGLLLIGIGGIYFWKLLPLNAPIAMAVNVIAGVISLGLGIIFFQKLLPREVKHVTPKYSSESWLNTAFQMLIYGGAQLVLFQIDIVMLGVIRNPEEVGLYAVATRLAYLLMYVTVAMEIIVAPVMARLFTGKDLILLQGIVSKSVRIAFVLTMPIGIFLLLMGDQVLAIFGHQFVASDTSLQILVVGRLLYVAMGSGGLLLAMTGKEKALSFIVTGTAIANIIFNTILIPKFGIEGAAFSTSISLVIVQLLLWVYTIRKNGIDVTIKGRNDIKMVTTQPSAKLLDRSNG